jgi:hypothetical protein
MTTAAISDKTVRLYPSLPETPEQVHHIYLEIGQPASLHEEPTTKEKAIQVAGYALLALGMFALASGAVFCPIGSAELISMYTETILPAAFVAVYLGYQILMGRSQPRSVGASLKVGPFAISY